jgi:hypothetical protein
MRWLVPVVALFLLGAVSCDAGYDEDDARPETPKTVHWVGGPIRVLAPEPQEIVISETGETGEIVVPAAEMPAEQPYARLRRSPDPESLLTRPDFRAGRRYTIACMVVQWVPSVASGPSGAGPLLASRMP